MADRALEGVRVVEFTDDVGAYCGKLLADLGADVIKVEPPGGGFQRHTPPYFHDREGVDTGIAFWFQNTSKRSIVLDLDVEADRAVVRRLVAGADILIEDFPPGVPRRTRARLRRCPSAE